MTEDQDQLRAQFQQALDGAVELGFWFPSAEDDGEGGREGGELHLGDFPAFVHQELDARWHPKSRDISELTNELLQLVQVHAAFHAFGYLMSRCGHWEFWNVDYEEFEATMAVRALAHALRDPATEHRPTWEAYEAAMRHAWVMHTMDDVTMPLLGEVLGCAFAQAANEAPAGTAAFAQFFSDGLRDWCDHQRRRIELRLIPAAQMSVHGLEDYLRARDLLPDLRA